MRKGKPAGLFYGALSLLSGCLAAAAALYAVYCLVLFDEDYWFGELIFIGWSGLLGWLSWWSFGKARGNGVRFD